MDANAELLALWFKKDSKDIIVEIPSTVCFFVISQANEFA